MLLIEDRPLMVGPKLAQAIGLNEAIVLQQIHFWVKFYRQAKDKRHFKDGEWWVWNTGKEWTGNFPFWSERTLWRIIGRLRESFEPTEAQKAQGMVARGPLLIVDNHNQHPSDRTNWYRINYAELKQVERRTQVHSETPDPDPVLEEGQRIEEQWFPNDAPEPARKTADEYLDSLRQTHDRMAKRFGGEDGEDLMWGSRSPLFTRTLRRADVDEEGTRRLGRYLERELGMAPIWTDADDVKRWAAGLVKLHKLIGDKHEYARKAYQEMKADRLTVDSPFSLLKTARHIAREAERVRVATKVPNDVNIEHLIEQFVNE